MPNVYLSARWLRRHYRARSTLDISGGANLTRSASLVLDAVRQLVPMRADGALRLPPEPHEQGVSTKSCLNTSEPEAPMNALHRRLPESCCNGI